MMQGVSTDRMVYEGKGIHDPVASNDTPEGRSLNRRVEIVILANQKYDPRGYNKERFD